MADAKQKKGFSLAKGPVALVGLALLVYGVTAFILGGKSFSTEPLSGTVTGETWLGLEVNAWSSILFIAAGLLLLFGAPLHWGAKSMSLIVGLVLGAASVIALYDGDDVFGIFAANGLTALVWGVAAAVLLILALLPRVGGKRKDRGQADDQPVERDRTVEREVPRERVVEREVPRDRIVEREAPRDPAVERDVPSEGRFSRETPVTGEKPAARSAGNGDIVAPASGTTPESRVTTRRRQDDSGR